MLCVCDFVSRFCRLAIVQKLHVRISLEVYLKCTVRRQSKVSGIFQFEHYFLGLNIRGQYPMRSQVISSSEVIGMIF